MIAQISIIIISLLIACIGLYIIRSSNTIRSGIKTKEIRKNIKKLSQEYNLEKHHIKLLDQMINEQNITVPQLLFQKESLLDKALEKFVANIQQGTMPQDEKDKMIANIFEIKNNIKYFSANKKSHINSSRDIRSGHEITVLSKTKLPPNKMIIANNFKEHLIINESVNSEISVREYEIGAIVKVHIQFEETKLYTFITKIKSIQNIDGEDSLLLAHTSKVLFRQLRKNQRKDFNKTAYFQEVEVVEENGKKRAVVKRKSRRIGKIINISKGGCAVQTVNVPVAQGKFIKILFNFESNDEIVVFGKVKYIKNLTPRGYLMHIIFTKVAVQYLNKIQSYVFGFSDN